MRDLVYYVACSLDGFIAQENGSFGAFPADPAYLAELLEQIPETFPAPMRPGTPTRAENRRFDAVLMGRKTYEVGLQMGLSSPYPTLDQYVISQSMTSSPDEAVRLIRSDPAEAVAHLKNETGKDIWLCGGAALASTLFGADLIDEVIVKVNPILLGSGIPLVAGRIDPTRLELQDTRVFPSGHVRLDYRVEH